MGAFPDTSCQRLRLQPLPAGYGEQAAKYAGLRDDLRDRFAAARCLPIPAGVALVRAALARHGLSGWSVTTAQTGRLTPCAAFAPDSEQRRITLVGQVSPDLVDTIDRALAAVNGSCHAGSRPAGVAAARRAVITALHDHGYGDWTVTVAAAATPAQPCYSAGVDPWHQVVPLSSYTKS